MSERIRRIPYNDDSSLYEILSIISNVTGAIKRIVYITSRFFGILTKPTFLPPVTL